VVVCEPLHQVHSASWGDLGVFIETLEAASRRSVFGHDGVFLPEIFVPIHVHNVMFTSLNPL
jgi:hypothetical protein